MDRRAFMNFITKRSSIWTLGLCMTGAIVLGGIAAVDNVRDSGEEQIQTESEIDGWAYLDEEENEITQDAESGSAEAAINEEEQEDLAAASGEVAEAVDETGLTGADLIQDEAAVGEDMIDANAENAADGSNLSDTGDDTAAQKEDSAEYAVSDEVSEAASDAVISEQALLDAGISFSEEEALLWPSAGTILIDYSMDSSVYFDTLNQYKYNPALIIGSETGNQVLSSAKGIVESIGIDEETGTTLVLNIGNGYKLTYGQLKELAVAEGDLVEAGALLGYVSEPTKYFVEEGSNLYFAMTKDETAVDPVLYLE